MINDCKRGMISHYSFNLCINQFQKISQNFLQVPSHQKQILQKNANKKPQDSLESQNFFGPAKCKLFKRIFGDNWNQLTLSCRYDYWNNDVYLLSSHNFCLHRLNILCVIIWQFWHYRNDLLNDTFRHDLVHREVDLCYPRTSSQQGTFLNSRCLSNVPFPEDFKQHIFQVSSVARHKR